MNFTKLIKLICAGATIGACLLATGCEVNTTVNKNTVIEGYGEGYTKQDDGTVISDASKVDFTDYVSFTNETDFSIKVNNNTARRLIAFKGTPNKDTLIGGIPAYYSNFGLKNIKTLFKTTGDFVLFLVTEEDYIANQSNITALSEMPFAKLFAFYNTQVENNTNVFEISKNVGGLCSIQVNNVNGLYNIELRMNGVNGTPLGYAAAGSANTVFKVEPGQYYIFPVIRKYDTVNEEIVTVFPRKNGKAVFKYFELGPDLLSTTLETSDWMQEEYFTANAAYIKINNHSGNGLSLYQGTIGGEITTSTGSKVINDGHSRIFQFKMDLTAGSSTQNPVYASYKTIPDLNVKHPGMANRIYITTNATTTSSAGNFDFYAGKLYEVSVWPDDVQDVSVDLSWKTNANDYNIDLRVQ